MKQKILNLKEIIIQNIKSIIDKVINKRKWIKRNKPISIILIVITIIIFVIVVHTGKKVFKNEERKNNANTFNSFDSSQLSVSVGIPKYDTITTSFVITGKIVPFENVVIMTELTNLRVKEIYAEVGDIVKNGQKLLLLDNDSLNYQYLQLKKEYELVYDEYVRAERLKHTEAITKAYYVQKLKNMEVVKAKMQEAQLNLERSLITAPAEGVIYERQATIGALTTNNYPLYQLAYGGKIELEAEVPETLITELKVGQEAIININGFTAENSSGTSQTINSSHINDLIEPIIGKIRLIQQNIDSLTRTVKIRISCTNQLFLPIGLFANVKIITNRVSGMTLPANSVQEDNTGSYLWKVVSFNSCRKVTKLPVKIRARNADYIVIEDIVPDNEIVIQAGGFLNEGDFIKVKDN